MWTTDIKDADQKFGSRTLLREAYEVLMGLIKAGTLTLDFSNPRADRDHYGIVAYETSKYFLVAKKSPYGDIVSVHKDTWDMAVKQEKAIVMYIESSKYFYEFKPWLIADMQVNHRGQTAMANFSIREGINLVKLAGIMAQSADGIAKNTKRGGEINEEKKEDKSQTALW